MTLRPRKLLIDQVFLLRHTLFCGSAIISRLQQSANLYNNTSQNTHTRAWIETKTKQIVAQRNGFFLFPLILLHRWMAQKFRILSSGSYGFGSSCVCVLIVSTRMMFSIHQPAIWTRKREGNMCIERMSGRGISCRSQTTSVWLSSSVAANQVGGHVLIKGKSVCRVTIPTSLA